MKKYYFISYHILIQDKLQPWTRFFNEVIDIHPFEWQLEMHEKYRKGKPFDVGHKYRAPELYVLLYYKEITEEEYKIGLKIEY